MAVSASQMLQRQDAKIISVIPGTGITLYGNTICFTDAATGYHTDTDNNGANQFAAIVWNDLDNSGGSAGDIEGDGWTCGRFLLTGSGFAQTDVGKKIYATDNFTITTSSTNSSVIGTCVAYHSSTQLWVELDVQKPAPGSATANLYIPDAVSQSLSGAGAINVTAFLTKWTTTAADAGTLADGTYVGQLKKIQLIVDGGDGTLTPSNLANGTTITFADAGDFALLMWNGADWRAIELGNDADGVTAPVLA